MSTKEIVRLEAVESKILLTHLTQRILNRAHNLNRTRLLRRLRARLRLRLRWVRNMSYSYAGSE